MSDLSDEGAVLVCRLTAQGPPGVAGSVEKGCSACGRDVWASPESLKAAARHGPVTFRCIPCAVGALPPERWAKLTPGQVRELLDAGVVEFPFGPDDDE